MKMPAGTYYIGDPCYIFEDSWDKVLNSTNYLKDNELFGKPIFVDSTAYGDGYFYDNRGRAYAVDAGMIGILPIELIEVDNVVTKEYIEKSEIMHMVTFEKEFECNSNEGFFEFGDITINTAEDEDDEDDYEEEDDYDLEEDEGEEP